MADDAARVNSGTKAKRSPLQWLCDLFRSKSKAKKDALHATTPCTPPPPLVQPVSPNSGLTDEEKDMIYRATCRHGVWYMCPQRHPYLVTECGTPLQMATCPTCGSVIGGKHHKFIGAYQTGNSFFTKKGVV